MLFSDSFCNIQHPLLPILGRHLATLSRSDMSCQLMAAVPCLGPIELLMYLYVVRMLLIDAVEAYFDVPSPWNIVYLFQANVMFGHHQSYIYDSAASVTLVRVNADMALCVAMFSHKPLWRKNDCTQGQCSRRGTILLSPQP